MSDAWYYADGTNKTGPVSLADLSQALAKRQHPRDVLVWCAGFPNWVRVENVPELRAKLPPPLPIDAKPNWRVPWWWYVVGLCFGVSVGNRVGRAEMGRVSALRSQARRAKKLSRLKASADKL
jgi:hypothetical protein